MKRLITIEGGVVGDVEKELLERLLPQIVGSFTQHKEFFEYFFEEKVLELTLDDIERLSTGFTIEICWTTLLIKI